MIVALALISRPSADVFGPGFIQGHVFVVRPLSCGEDSAGIALYGVNIAVRLLGIFVVEVVCCSYCLIVLS